jgi:ankyrin repeat protein
MTLLQKIYYKFIASEKDVLLKIVQLLKNKSYRDIRALLERRIDLNIEVYGTSGGAASIIHHCLERFENHNSFNYDILEFFLIKGADLTAKNGYGMTPLHRAVSIDFHLTKFFLEKNINPSIRDKNLLTPLHYANNYESSKLLIHYGAEINALSAKSLSPLDFSLCDHKKALLLLEHGAEPNINKFYKHLDITTTKDLLEDVSEVPYRFTSYLDLVENDDLFKAYTSNLDLDYTDENGDTPLHKICEIELYDGSDKYLDVFKTKAADFNKVNKKGFTPIQIAVIKTNYKLIEKLVSLGADLNHMHNDRFTAHDCLIKFVIKEDEEVDIGISERIKKTIDVIRKCGGKKSFYLDKDASKLTQKLTELTTESKSKIEPKNTSSINVFDLRNDNYKELLKIEIKNGLDPNSRNDSGETILHLAAKDCNFDVAEILISSGAELNATDYEGCTPIDHADEDVFEYLESYGAKHKSIFTALDNMNFKAVRKFLSDGVHIDERDSRGDTLLMLAANDGDIEIVDYLIKNEVTINARDANYCTALDYSDQYVETYNLLKKHGGLHGTLHGAVSANCIDSIKRLLSEGYYVDSRNELGSTALHEASTYDVGYLLIKNGAKADALNNQGESTIHHKRDTKLLQLLIINGADVNKKIEKDYDKGKTPLDLLSREKDKVIYEFLRSRGAKKGHELHPIKTDS